MSKFPELFFHESIGRIGGSSRSTGPPGNLMVSSRKEFFKAAAMPAPSAAWRLWFNYCS